MTRPMFRGGAVAASRSATAVKGGLTRPEGAAMALNATIVVAGWLFLSHSWKQWLFSDTRWATKLSPPPTSAPTTAPASRPSGRYAVGLRPSLDPDAYLDVRAANEDNPNPGSPRS